MADPTVATQETGVAENAAGYLPGSGFASDGEAAEAFLAIEDSDTLPPKADEDGGPVDQGEAPAEGTQNTKLDAEEALEDDSVEAVEDSGEDDAHEESEGEEQDEQESFESLAELAEASGIPFDKFMSEISHTFQAAGQTRTATLNDLVRGHQLYRDYEQKSEGLARQQEQFNAQATQAAAFYNDRLQEVDTLINSLAGAPPVSEEELSRILEDEGSDAHYQARLKNETHERRIYEATQRRLKIADDHAQEIATNAAQVRLQSQHALPTLIPAYAKPENQPKLETGWKSYLSGEGFTGNEVQGFFDGPFDARIVKVIHKAAMYDALMENKGKVAKLVKGKPRMNRSGPGRGPGKAKDQQARAAFNQLRKTGSDDAALALLVNTGALD
mgnify:CR=1 FL=1